MFQKGEEEEATTMSGEKILVSRPQRKKENGREKKKFRPVAPLIWDVAPSACVCLCVDRQIEEEDWKC